MLFAQCWCVWICERKCFVKVTLGWCDQSRFHGAEANKGIDGKKTSVIDFRAWHRTHFQLSNRIIGQEDMIFKSELKMFILTCIFLFHSFTVNPCWRLFHRTTTSIPTCCGVDARRIMRKNPTDWANKVEMIEDSMPSFRWFGAGGVIDNSLLLTVCPWKFLWLGDETTFLLGRLGLFSGAFAVSFREDDVFLGKTEVFGWMISFHRYLCSPLAKIYFSHEFRAWSGSLASEINVSKLKQGSNRAGKDFGAGTHFVSDAGDELRRERRTNTTTTTLLLRSPRWVSGLLGLVPSVRQTCEILLPACPTGMITVSDNQYQGLTIRESCVKLRWPQAKPASPWLRTGSTLSIKAHSAAPPNPRWAGSLLKPLPSARLWSLTPWSERKQRRCFTPFSKPARMPWSPRWYPKHGLWTTPTAAPNDKRITAV